jgi:hypothetical protein
MAKKEKKFISPPKPISLTKSVEEQISETSDLIEKLTSLTNKAAEKIGSVFSRVKDEDLTIRDLRDLGYVLAVLSDKRELLLEQKARLEGSGEATSASIARQLEGIAALQGELTRRNAALEHKEASTIDVTPEEDAENADEGFGPRTEPEGGSQPAAEAQSGPGEAVSGVRRPRPGPVRNAHGRTWSTQGRGRV